MGMAAKILLVRDDRGLVIATQEYQDFRFYTIRSTAHMFRALDATPAKALLYVLELMN